MIGLVDTPEPNIWQGYSVCGTRLILVQSKIPRLRVVYTLSY